MDYRKMTRQKKIQFYVTDQEYEKLKEYALKLNVSMAEVLRDYIKFLVVESRPPKS